MHKFNLKLLVLLIPLGIILCLFVYRPNPSYSELAECLKMKKNSFVRMEVFDTLIKVSDSLECDSIILMKAKSSILYIAKCSGSVAIRKYWDKKENADFLYDFMNNNGL